MIRKSFACTPSLGYVNKAMRTHLEVWRALQGMIVLEPVNLWEWVAQHSALEADTVARLGPLVSQRLCESWSCRLGDWGIAHLTHGWRYSIVLLFMNAHSKLLLLLVKLIFFISACFCLFVNMSKFSLSPTFHPSSLPAYSTKSSLSHWHPTSLFVCLSLSLSPHSLSPSTSNNLSNTFPDLSIIL